MKDDELYEYLGQLFEWDKRKAALNALHHKVRFTEAATIIFDDDAIYEPDPDHSEDENCYIVIGTSAVANLLVVVHLYRGERIRIVSARKPAPAERRTYESRLGK